MENEVEQIRTALTGLMECHRLYAQDGPDCGYYAAAKKLTR